MLRNNFGLTTKLGFATIVWALVAISGSTFLVVQEQKDALSLLTLVNVNDPGSELLTRSTEKLNALLYTSHRMTEEIGTPAVQSTIARFRGDMVGLKDALDGAEEADQGLRYSVESFKKRFEPVRKAMSVVADTTEAGHHADLNFSMNLIDHDGVLLAIDMGHLAAIRSSSVKLRAKALSVSTQRRTYLACSLIMAAGLTVVLAGILGSTRMLVRPMVALRRSMLVLAQGDLEQPIPFTGRRDEVGAIANALAAIQGSLRQVKVDSLTCLSNRYGLELALKTFMDDNKKSEEIDLFYIDLDKFKRINDTLGHATGDLILQETALRIAKHLGEEDHAARLGGDEFVVLRRRKSAENNFYAMADRLTSDLRQPVYTSEGAIEISASIGVAHLDDSVTSGRGLLHHADIAMYAAKAKGGGVGLSIMTYLRPLVTWKVRSNVVSGRR